MKGDVMQIRLAKGLWRLWLVASVIWVSYFSVSFGTAYVALAPRVKPVGLSFDDLIPQYKSCWDFRTEDGKNIDIQQMSDAVLVGIYQCQLKADKLALLKSAAITVAGGPFLSFILGWSLLWIGRGFRPAL
jgi:hypothetical protein